jgi:hypothetical protein
MSVSGVGKTVPVTSEFTDIPGLSTYIPITQLLMTLSHAYLQFANNQTDDLVPRLDWVNQVSSAQNSGAYYYDHRALRANSQDVGRPTRVELDNLSGRAALLLE